MRSTAPAAGLLVALAVVGVSCAGEDGATDRGDGAITVVLDADVRTMDEDRPRAEAFAHDSDGTIIAVGAEPDVVNAAGDEATTVDAGARLVLPGFQDAHVHVPEAGINEDLCLLPPTEPLEDYERLVSACAAQQADEPWVRAAGPSLFALVGGDELPVDVLDRAVPDRPALVLDDLGHAVWTNTAGLEAAGISEDDADPPGGVFDRDPGTGRLTGLLLENAQHRVRDVATLDEDVVDEALLVALDELAANGVTTISDAGGFWRQGHPEAWERAVDEGTVTVRALNSLYLYPDRDPVDQLAELERRFHADPHSLVRFTTAKIYVDGIVDLGTAALLTPYDQPIDPGRPFGFEYFEPDELQDYAAALHDIGFQLDLHVIGDAAVRRGLDIIEAIPAGDVAERHHRLTHVYLVDPNDLGRFAELGVVADQQQGPDAIAPEYHESLVPLIGDRALDLIPTDELLAAGAPVTLSSDWDADPLSPFGTIARAVARPTHAVPDIETAVRMMTIDAATALRHDDLTGSIEIGKQADYLIVDRDIFGVPAPEVADAEVLLTAVGGTEVYRSADF